MLLADEPTVCFPHDVAECAMLPVPLADAMIERACTESCICRPVITFKPRLAFSTQNHLDTESVAWLEKTLAAFPGTVVAVTHDR